MTEKNSSSSKMKMKKMSRVCVSRSALLGVAGQQAASGFIIIWIGHSLYPGPPLAQWLADVWPRFKVLFNLYN